MKFIGHCVSTHNTTYCFSSCVGLEWPQGCSWRRRGSCFLFHYEKHGHQHLHVACAVVCCSCSCSLTPSPSQICVVCATTRPVYRVRIHTLTTTISLPCPPPLPRCDVGGGETHTTDAATNFWFAAEIFRSAPPALIGEKLSSETPLCAYRRLKMAPYVRRSEFRWNVCAPRSTAVPL